MQARRACGERQRLVYGQQYQPVSSHLDEINKRKLAVADLVDSSETPMVDAPEVRIASPESYLAAKGDITYQLSDRDAAYALQELHNHCGPDVETPKAPQTWSAPASQAPKRKWMPESDLQENVRDLLTGHPMPPSQPSYTPFFEESSPDYFGVKRTRVTAPNPYQAHFREGYGQHLLIPTA